MRRSNLFLSLFLILCLASAISLPHCARKPKESASAPDFTLKTLEDQEISLSGLRGKVVLLDFWATWCGPCRESIPHLIQLYRSYQEEGFELIGMSLDKKEEADKVRHFVRSMDIPYPIILAPEDVSKNYGITGLPTTILIDKEGRIRDKIVGFNSSIAQQIAARVAELTSEKP
ncbi:MAG: TlpA disulfide reductase family protein [Thermodesulfobacteriota bacterium]|nr:TlpA disulfide reductase family protein [Thermodesulfobacteriota bacterium]